MKQKLYKMPAGTLVVGKTGLLLSCGEIGYSNHLHFSLQISPSNGWGRWELPHRDPLIQEAIDEIIPTENRTDFFGWSSIANEERITRLATPEECAAFIEKFPNVKVNLLRGQKIVSPEELWYASL